MITFLGDPTIYANVLERICLTNDNKLNAYINNNILCAAKAKYRMTNNSLSINISIFAHILAVYFTAVI